MSEIIDLQIFSLVASSVAFEKMKTVLLFNFPKKKKVLESKIS